MLQCSTAATAAARTTHLFDDVDHSTVHVSITRSRLHMHPRCMHHMIVCLGPAPRADVMHQPPKAPLYHSDLQKRHCTPGYTCREHRYVERHACRPSVMWSMREFTHSHNTLTYHCHHAYHRHTHARMHARAHAARICTRIRVLTMHFFTHARARARTHTHTHTHTHTLTHTHTHTHTGCRVRRVTSIRPGVLESWPSALAESLHCAITHTRGTH
jgi:hypothetical protein